MADQSDVKNGTSFGALIWGPTANLCVGSVENLYRIPRALLRHYTTYFDDALTSHDDQRPIDLKDESPKLFPFLLQWMYQGELRIIETMKAEKEPEEAFPAAAQTLCKLWLLADKLSIKYIGDVIITQIHDITLGTEKVLVEPQMVREVFAETAEGSAIRECLVDRIAYDLETYRDHGIGMWRELMEGPDAVAGFSVMLVEKMRDVRERHR